MGFLEKNFNENFGTGREKEPSGDGKLINRGKLKLWYRNVTGNYRIEEKHKTGQERKWFLESYFAS